MGRGVWLAHLLHAEALLGLRVLWIFPFTHSEVRRPFSPRQASAPGGDGDWRGTRQGEEAGGSRSAKAGVQVAWGGKRKGGGNRSASGGGFWGLSWTVEGAAWGHWRRIKTEGGAS